MPIYEYTCPTCNLMFEEISSIADRYKGVSCNSCGAVANPNVLNTFGVISKSSEGTIAYSTNEVDRVIGRKAEEKWLGYNDKWKDRYRKRQEARREGKEIKDIPMDRESDGKFAPLLNLGSKQERDSRREYSESLQKHREDRKQKGLGQFDSTSPLEIE